MRAVELKRVTPQINRSSGVPEVGAFATFWAKTVPYGDLEKHQARIFLCQKGHVRYIRFASKTYLPADFMVDDQRRFDAFIWTVKGHSHLILARGSQDLYLHEENYVELAMELEELLSKVEYGKRLMEINYILDVGDLAK